MAPALRMTRSIKEKLPIFLLFILLLLSCRVTFLSREYSTFFLHAQQPIPATNPCIHIDVDIYPSQQNPPSFIL
ncbi:hypothetical protein F5X99DRAFT_384392, partial [Biscogniauxia marginata]